MIYEKNSIQRYQEGKELSDKYTPEYIKSIYAMLLWGFLSMVFIAKFDFPLVACITFVLVPFIPGMKASLLATKGDIMMKSAEETWGSDEEEY